MFKSVKANEIAVSICLFIIGLCIFIWADKVTNLVSLILGSVLVAHSVLTGIEYFKCKEKNTMTIVSIVISLTFGIILISRPSIISEVISFVVGIYILLSSLSSLSLTLNSRK